MRRTFLTALLLAAFAAVVFAPSAMTKKEPPTPPAPSGTFTLNAYSTIAVTGMTLTSQNEVTVAVCAWYSDGTPTPECASLGSNTGALGQEVALDDWSITSPLTVPLTLRLVLGDQTTGTIYTSDGMTIVAGQLESGASHAALGWTTEGAILLSMNDGSESGESVPALGEGNFNATIGITGHEWPVTITNITGYSDGATVDESNTPMCGFHAVITYTMGKGLKKKVTATGTTVLFTPPSEGVGYATASLDASPFDPGTFNVLPTNLRVDIDYQFMAVIDDTDTSTSDWLGMQASAMFRLDPATFVDGCPAVGELVSTDFG